MARAPADARAHVFVADPAAPLLSPPDRHHLERVLRLRPGEEVTVSDGAGRWRWCRMASGIEGLDPVGEVHEEPRPQPPVAVAFALTKGERPEWTVQKLTELGVDAIVPFIAERSVVRWPPERAAAQVERWRRIAREAAAQSRRVWLAEVEAIRSFADVLSRAGAALADPDGMAPSLGHRLLAVGPEGGWSGAEREAAAAVPLVTLGDQILRAETAALAAGALLCALRAGIVEPGSGGES